MTEAVKKSHAIIRGRIPLAIVYLIRFVEDAGAGSKNLAEKYATTVGKIDDIKKNRNFAYVTEEVRFTQVQIDEAKAYINQHENPDDAVVILDKLNALELATPEQAEAFAAVKRKNNGQDRTDAEGNVIEAGGGNRQGKKGKKEEAPADETAPASEPAEAEAQKAPSAEDLMDI